MLPLLPLLPFTTICSTPRRAFTVTGYLLLELKHEKKMSGSLVQPIDMCGASQRLTTARSSSPIMSDQNLDSDIGQECTLMVYLLTYLNRNISPPPTHYQTFNTTCTSTIFCPSFMADGLLIPQKTRSKLWPYSNFSARAGMCTLSLVLLSILYSGSSG